MSHITKLVVAGLAIGLLCGTASAQAPLNAQAGVEALGRGPIHEAFAQPVNPQPEPGPMAPQQPPAQLDEAPPDQKPQGDNVQWIPGYWQWDDDKKEFIWISGFWRQPPPGRVWVPGQYKQTPDGWQWVPGYWNAGDPQRAQLLPQPPAPIDAAPGTPPPSDDSIYVPGSWVYRDARYRWRPAYYLDYHPGWVWQPAQYLWTPNGYVFVDGYWDYALDQRGLLFAPVAIDPSLLATPNWCYTPSYVVNCDFLPSALFVRPCWQHYYFGDYFGPTYAGLGYTPWQNVRLGARGWDPLFGYARRGAGAWVNNLNSLYAARNNGSTILPPRTWSQQQALVRKIATDPKLKGTNLTHVTPLTPLSQVKSFRLQNAPRDQRRIVQPQITTARNPGNVASPAFRPQVVTSSAPRVVAAPPATSNIRIINSGMPAARIRAPAPQVAKMAAPKIVVHNNPAPARAAPAHVAHSAPARAAPAHVAHAAPAHASHGGGGHSAGKHK